MAFFKNKSPLFKRMTIMVIILIIFFGLLFGYNGLRAFFIKQYFANFQPPAAVISATTAATKTWKPEINSVGTLVAINGVDVTSQVAGQVTKINFESGQMVKAGDLLINLDDSADLQDLKNYKAQLALAQISYKRQSELFKNKNTAQSALDEAKAQLEEAEALMDKTQILINQKAIRAPFTGKIGIRQVNLGQYISPGTTLVNLQALDPLYIQFSLPEQYLKSIAVGQPVEISVDAYKDESFKGQIDAINSQVDPQTRNVLVQAIVSNKDNRLYPGMFANINILLPQQENVVVVPQTAISFNLYGDSIYVIKPDKDKKGKPILRAHIQYITTGERRANEVVVLKGIKAGEEIVSSGQLKLQDGAQVEINNSVDLKNNTTMDNHS